MKKYFIYHGTINCDKDPFERISHQIKMCDTIEEVIKFKKEFNSNLRDDDNLIAFRVFEGIELEFKPKEVVIDYDLVEKK